LWIEFHLEEGPLNLCEAPVIKTGFQFGHQFADILEIANLIWNLNNLLGPRAEGRYSVSKVRHDV
jgi:hypothetical protein